MTCTYPGTSIVADYVRAALGVCLTLGPLLAVPVIPVFLVLALLGGATFLCYAATTLRRQLTRVDMDGRGISLAPWGGSMRWEALDDLRLRYFSTRRDGRDGWMYLTLHGAGQKISVDSRITHFDELLRRAVSESERNALALSPVTASNLAALHLPGSPGEAGA